MSNSLSQDKKITFQSQSENGTLVLAAVAAFGTYFCMYAFRKPFSAGTFDEPSLVFWGLGLKTILVLSQLFGYMVSKFIGIRVISEMKSEYRSWTILALILFAEAALIGFAFLPVPLKVFMMFLNGLPLGMVFGLVLGYLEGRRQTEALSAVLCASFIASSGVVKSFGASLIGAGLSEFTMPMVVGFLFLPMLGLAVWLLQRTPAPTIADKDSRSERRAMTRSERNEFIIAYWPGLTLLVAIYTTLTIVRTIRDDFGVEIWRDMGNPKMPMIFAYSETIVALIVTISNAGLIYVIDNKWALRITLVAVGIMCALVGLSGVLFTREFISPLTFMIACGVGLYFPYVVFHTTVFERIIAVSRRPCNLGFLMYLADSIGYLGYAVVIVWRSINGQTLKILPFYLTSLSLFAIMSVLMVIAVILYFEIKLKADKIESLPAELPS